MSTRVETLRESVMVVGASVLLITVLAGVVGAMWRMAFWGSMHGTGATGHHVLDSPGFELGFGVPLPTVVVWATLVAVVLGVSYFLHREIAARDGRRR